jgi:RNA polymerase subunit RPABC4/transcription elongation factor Spt4
MSDLLTPITSSAEFQFGWKLCAFFYVILTIALIFWTWRDADRRGGMAWFWAVVVLLFNVPGWIIYMVVRPPEYLDDAHERALEIRAAESRLSKDGATCPSCMKPVESDMLICPYCMKKLKKPCVKCGRALKMSWGVCPYCKTKQTAGEVADAMAPAHATPREPGRPKPQA